MIKSITLFVEMFKETEAGGLIDPSQVVVTQGEVHIAHPILLPLGKSFVFLWLLWNKKLIKYDLPEKLRLKDREISNALEEKHRLISEIFDVSDEKFEQSHNRPPPSDDTEAKDVLLAALTQGIGNTKLSSGSCIIS
jgi:hypothetical protein